MAAPAWVERAFSNDAAGSTCLCQGMVQWCVRGLHQHCVCPHNGGRFCVAAILRHPDGRYVLDPVTGTSLAMYLTPRPCPLRDVCPCGCHPAQRPLFTLPERR